jgi:ribose transport system ATP-binding protein
MSGGRRRTESSAASRTRASENAVVVRFGQVSKSFGTTRALDRVDLEIRRGEVHALVGGNGSGKSTLIKILAGVLPADSGGTLEVAGRAFDLRAYDAHAARDAGLRFVHQDAGVFPELSVMENLAIGREFPTSRVGTVRWRDVRRQARAVLERFQIPAAPDTPLVALGPAMRMMVAIARALQDADDDAGILVLDEPTAALPSHEVEVLMDAVRRYARSGHSIVYVSHRLDEVLALADRVSALRDGHLVDTVDAAPMTEEQLIQLVVGRDLDRVYPHMPEPDATRTPVVTVDDLHAGPLRGISLTVTEREVVGIAGLLGSGRSTLLQAIFGALPTINGEIKLHGRPLRARSPKDAIDMGIAYVPEDRPRAAAFPDLSVQDNVGAAQVSRYWRRLRIDRARERAEARASLTEFLVKAPSPAAPLTALSGGNQQKVILARWLRRRPKLLLLDEPTQGVDIGARAEIYQLVRAAVAGGAAAIVVSSDFEELSRVCDRVLVLAGGRIVADVSGRELGPQRLTELTYSSTELTG